MVDYKIALKRPFSDWKKLAIGCLIILGFIVLAFIIAIPFSLITLFSSNILLQYIPNLIFILIFAIPTTYFLICGLTASKKKFILPSWSKFGDLFRKGIKLGVISIIYLIPLLLIMVPLTNAIIGPELSAKISATSSTSFLDRLSPEFQATQEELSSQLAPKFPALFITILLIGLIWFLITSIATLRFIEKEKFKDAFEFSKIFKIAFSSEYIIATLLLLLINIAAIVSLGIIGSILAITIVGIILIPVLFLVYAYALGVTSYTIIGQAYGEIK